MKIPDFDMLETVANDIVELSRQKGLLEVKIKFEESEVVKKATSQPEFFQGGKPPSMAFIESTYKYQGFTGELIALRQELVEVTAKLEKARLTWEIFKQQFEIYRTESANNRATGQLL